MGRRKASPRSTFSLKKGRRDEEETISVGFF